MGRDNFYLHVKRLADYIIRHHILLEDQGLRLAVGTFAKTSSIIFNSIVGQTVTQNMSKCGDVYDKHISNYQDMCKSTPEGDYYWKDVVFDTVSACTSTEDARIVAYKGTDRLFSEGKDMM